MTTAVETSKANRADLMLVALRSMAAQDVQLSRSQLEKELTRLVRDDHVGVFFRPYFRQALLHRAVVETLAYLETNEFIEADLSLTPSGVARIAKFDAIQKDVDRALTSALA